MDQHALSTSPFWAELHASPGERPEEAVLQQRQVLAQLPSGPSVPTPHSLPDSGGSSSETSPPGPQDDSQCQGRRRHCWECRRRSLVCDGGEPSCQRCLSTDIACPGYGSTKPARLRWLAPGKVQSRGPKQRKNNRNPGPQKEEKAAKKDTKDSELKQITTMSLQVAISRFDAGTEVFAGPQAVDYYNATIYPYYTPSLKLGDSPEIFPLSQELAKKAAASTPDYLRFGMVCMLLAHRINQHPHDEGSKELAERFYRYWGLAIQSLNLHLNAKDPRRTDSVISGILTLLLADFQHGSALNWRCHLEAVHRMIDLRGGIRAVAHSKTLRPVLSVVWYLEIIGNTTCPPDQLHKTASNLQDLDYLLTTFGQHVFVFHSCPLPLVAQIIRINHLRDKAYAGATAKADLWKTADGILEAIHNFSATKWANTKPASHEDWIVLGKSYRAATALYCMLSLQSQSILPSAPTMTECCAVHGEILQNLLEEGLASVKTQRFLIWPLVVLGVQFVNARPEQQNFVMEELRRMSHDAGTHVPITAKHMLERFWASGETKWDACFDRAYAFTSKFAVDTTDLLDAKYVTQ